MAVLHPDTIAALSTIPEPERDRVILLADEYARAVAESDIPDNPEVVKRGLVEIFLSFGLEAAGYHMNPDGTFLRPEDN